MSTQAVIDWLKDMLDYSTQAAPLVEPYPAVYGVLLSAGFDASKVEVIKEASNSIDAKTEVTIVLDSTEENETPKTIGAQNMFHNEQSFDVEVYWVADFTGQPALNIAPEFDPGSAAALRAAYERFRVLVDAVKDTLRLTLKQYNNGGLLEARHWTLTDSVSGKVSVIRGREGQMRTLKQPAKPAENGIDLLFINIITVKFYEYFLS